jgi:hypothetical protein
MIDRREEILAEERAKRRFYGDMEWCSTEKTTTRCYPLPRSIDGWNVQDVGMRID